MTEKDPYATATYDYPLPTQLIAQSPAQRRDAARLFVLTEQGEYRHLVFSELPEVLRPDDLVVANDTQVMPARFFPRRRGGGACQVLLLHPADAPGTWVAMARPGKRIRPGDRLALAEGVGIEVLDRAPGGNRIVRFYGLDAESAMARYGQVPLPPYIRTPPPGAAERYQTVYARQPGSVAAPTAGLHFTPELLHRLAKRGIEWTTITLHVGAGTFRPVKADDIRQHVMHAEEYEITAEAAGRIHRARSAGRRIVAVGTTTLRALEDSTRLADGEVQPGRRWTTLFVAPPERIASVDVLVTNFHLPRSTLLMLVCAFAGTERILAAYAEAVRLDYRFYSFGDAMLIERPAP